MFKTAVVLSFAITFILVSCKVKQDTASPKAETKVAAGPHAIVYKTKTDCAQYVPITLGPDNKVTIQIVSYPAPTDIFRNGKLALPTPLTGGYLLDNRGISIHSCFINISYEDYSKLKTPPEMDEIANRIIDIQPFIEMYDLGLRSRVVNEVNEINAIIISGKLGDYKRLL